MQSVERPDSGAMHGGYTRSAAEVKGGWKFLVLFHDLFKSVSSLFGTHGFEQAKKYREEESESAMWVHTRSLNGCYGKIGEAHQSTLCPAGIERVDPADVSAGSTRSIPAG
jgi:hypothetical protein